MQLGAVIAAYDVTAEVPVVHEAFVVERRNELSLSIRQTAIIDFDGRCTAVIHVPRLRTVWDFHKCSRPRNGFRPPESGRSWGPVARRLHGRAPA